MCTTTNINKTPNSRFYISSVDHLAIYRERTVGFCVTITTIRVGGVHVAISFDQVMMLYDAV